MLAISNHTLHSKGLARLLASGGAGNSPNVNAIFTTDFIRIKNYSYFFLWASDAGRVPLLHPKRRRSIGWHPERLSVVRR